MSAASARSWFSGVARWLPLGVGILTLLASGVPSSGQAIGSLDSNCVVAAFNRTAWSGIVRGVSQAWGASSLCRNVDDKSSALLATRLPEGFATDVDTVRELVKTLQNEHDIPLSFIEDRTEEPIALPVAEQTLKEA